MSESGIINLPKQLTPFIGRRDELAEIARLLADPACRLLTLVGPGGIGKTRLGLEAARQSTFPNRVHFVPLQPLTSPDFIVSTIADAIGFQFYSGGEPKQQLLDFFRDKSMLLILDNFEHLLDGVYLLSEILAAAPDVRILATSRERLSLVEEWVLDIDGLSYPVSEAETDTEGYSAVQLFLQNARRVQVGFSLTDEHKPAVTRICHVVGGMPLGIELAAAWVRALSCEAIADEITHSLDILETPARNVEPRHRTMRAVFEPTWERLSEDERAVFMKLSVFRGGFTREAAEYIADASLRTLTALVDKSLLRVDANGRYDLHELLRQYAGEQLNASPDVNQTHDLHCAYYAEFLHQRENDLKGHRQKTALNEIDTDIDNGRAAWDWALERERVDVIEKASECLRCYYTLRSRNQEGEGIFRRAVERLTAGKQEQTLAMGKALLGQASCCESLGRANVALDLLQTSFSIFRHHEARWEMALALNMMGQATHADRRKREQFYQESLAISRDIGVQWLTAYNLLLLQEELFMSDFDEGARVLQDCLSLVRQTGDQRMLAFGLHKYARLSINMANYAKARQLLAENLILYQELGYPSGIAYSYALLGLLAHDLGEYAESQRYCEEGLVVAKVVGNGIFIGLNLLGLSRIALARKAYDEAKQLAHESLRLFTEVNTQSDIVAARIVLGTVACRLQEHDEAWLHFRDAVQRALKMELLPLALRTLVSMVELLAAGGHRPQMLELLVLTLHHKVSWTQTQDRARSFLAQVESELPAEAIQSIHDGWRTSDFHVDQLAAVLGLAAEDVTGLLSGLKQPVAAAPVNTYRTIHTLNERELEILRLVAAGMSNKEIAEQLALAVTTIKWYVSEIMSKLHVANRTQAVTRARALGMLS